MQKLPSVFLLGALLLSGPAVADEPVQPPYGHDSNPDACGAVLCLLGMTRDGDCDKYIQKYFSIKRYKHGHFSPSRTKAARGEAVQSCKDDEGLTKKANDIWGPVEHGF